MLDLSQSIPPETKKPDEIQANKKTHDQKPDMQSDLILEKLNEIIIILKEHLVDEKEDDGMENSRRNYLMKRFKEDR